MNSNYYQCCKHKILNSSMSLNNTKGKTNCRLTHFLQKNNVRRILFINSLKFTESAL